MTNYFKPVITNVRKVQGGTIMTLNCVPAKRGEKGAMLSLTGQRAK